MSGPKKPILDIESLKERFLECDICNEIFDEENRHPRLLPCLHTLCKKCIEKLIYEEKITCPKCLKVHNATDNSIESFQKDNTRRDLLDFVNAQKQPTTIVCESCDKNLPANFRCKDCSEFLCKDCNNYHSHNKKLKTHYVFSIDSINFEKEQLEDFKHESRCSIPEHNDALKFYCDKNTCKKPICTTCAIAEHKEVNNHVVRDILVVYGEEKEQMEKKKVALEKKKKTAQSIVKSIEEEENYLLQKGNTAKENITAQFETCFKILERRRDQLVKEVDETIARKSKVLENHRLELQNLNDSVTEAVSFYDQSLLYKNYPAFLEIVNTIENRFKDLTDQKIDAIPHENACVEFSPLNMGMEFQKYINTTGKVYYTSAYPPNTIIDVTEIGNPVGEIHFLVTLRDASGNEIADSENIPTLTLMVHSETETKEPGQVLCGSFDAGRYKAVTKGLTPGKYKIEATMFGKSFGLIVKEIPLKKNKLEKSDVAGKEKNLVPIVTTETQNPESDEKEKDRATVETVELSYSERDEKEKDRGPVAKAEKIPSEEKQFTFDPLTLHKERYISDDNLIISNVKQDNTHQLDNGDQALKTYDGVRGSIAITYPENCMIEIEMNYQITKDLSRTNLIFDIGFINADDTESHYYCGKNGFSIHSAKCSRCEKVCFIAEQLGKNLKHTPISDTTKNSSYKGIVKIFINSSKKEIKIVDGQNALFYTFTDVDFRNGLWPMFGVYNSDLVNAQLHLIKAIKGNDLKLLE